MSIENNFGPDEPAGQGAAQCCGIGYQPHWRRRENEPPRYVSVCQKCKVETHCHVTNEAREVLRLLVVTNELPTDPQELSSEEKEGEGIPEGLVENPAEPEAVKQLSAIMNGVDDGSAIQRIWIELRHSIKRAGQVGPVGWADIQAIIEAATKRARKQIKDPEQRQQVVGRLTIMANRAKEMQPVEPEELQDE